jgi:surface polysaccharide O-acyltransferase-like enzyme
MNRKYGLDSVRVALMVMVVIHHSILAYVPSGTGAQINDPSNFIWFEKLALYFDNFFMFTFFMLSGLFVIQGIHKKGSFGFIIDRFIRLLVPFAIVTLLINPIAQYYSYSYYYQLPIKFSSFFEFYKAVFGNGAAFQLWFLWVLFVFDILVLALFKLIGGNMKSNLVKVMKLFKNEVIFLLIMVVISYLIYSPLVDVLGNGFIMIANPFNVQLARIGVYFLYFLLGVLVGNVGLENTFWKQGRPLMKAILYLSASILFTVTLSYSLVYVTSGTITSPDDIKGIITLLKLMTILISLSVTVGLVYLSTLQQKKNEIISYLSKYSMGIYILHYVIVTVLQFYLVSVNVLPLFKGILVSFFGLFISAVLTMVLKKIPILNVIFGGRCSDERRWIYIVLTIVIIIFMVLT